MFVGWAFEEMVGLERNPSDILVESCGTRQKNSSSHGDYTAESRRREGDALYEIEWLWILKLASNET
jgi:hypothetical protein